MFLNFKFFKLSLRMFCLLQSKRHWWTKQKYQPLNRARHIGAHSYSTSSRMSLIWWSCLLKLEWTFLGLR